eukprot:gene26125-biopygen16600
MPAGGHSTRRPHAVPAGGLGVGVCMVGGVRSFVLRGVRERYRTHFWDTLPPPKALFANLQEISPSCDHVGEVIDFLRPTAFRVECITKEGMYKTERRSCPDADQATVGGMEKMIPQLEKMAACYNMVIDHEKMQGSRFAYLTRTRPDLLFYNDIPWAEWLRNDSVTFSNVGFPAYGGAERIKRGEARHVNDHAFGCPRRLCHAPFQLALDYNNCKGNFKQQFGYLWGSPVNQLGARVYHLTGPPTDVDFQYSIMRGCPHRLLRSGDW